MSRMCQCLTISVSWSCIPPVVSRSIWTLAPEFLWCPEAGRSPALRARRPSLSTQPATTVRPASPCCSTTKSSWRGWSPSQFKGCEGLTACACLIKCLQSSSPPHHPPPWFSQHRTLPTTCFTTKNNTDHKAFHRNCHSCCLPTTGRTVGLMFCFLAQNYSDTQEGGSHSTVENIITLLPVSFSFLFLGGGLHSTYIIYDICVFFFLPVLFCFVCVFCWIGWKKKKKSTQGTWTSHHRTHFVMQLRFVSFVWLFHCQYYSHLIGSTLMKETLFGGQLLKYWDTSL